MRLSPRVLPFGSPLNRVDGQSWRTLRDCLRRRLAEADAVAEGRKIRVTKVSFSASAKAVIGDDPRASSRSCLTPPPVWS